jgi:hypothetical protein
MSRSTVNRTSRLLLAAATAGLLTLTACGDNGSTSTNEPGTGVVGSLPADEGTGSDATADSNVDGATDTSTPAAGGGAGSTESIDVMDAELEQAIAEAEVLLGATDKDLADAKKERPTAADPPTTSPDATATRSHPGGCCAFRPRRAREPGRARRPATRGVAPPASAPARPPPTDPTPTHARSSPTRCRRRGAGIPARSAPVPGQHLQGPAQVTSPNSGWQLAPVANSTCAGWHRRNAGRAVPVDGAPPPRSSMAPPRRPPWVRGVVVGARSLLPKPRGPTPPASHHVGERGVAHRGPTAQCPCAEPHGAGWATPTQR